MVQLINN